MSVSAGFASQIYGMIEGSPPYTDANGNAYFTRVMPFNRTGVWNLPSGSGTTIIPLANGYQMPNGTYVYSVIEFAPTGLNVHGVQLVTPDSVSTLATSRG